MTAVIKPVTKRNLQEAIDLAVKISGEVYRTQIEQEFRASVGFKPEKSAVKRDLFITSSHFILLYDNGQPAGMAGHYRIDGQPQDAWLGWMGVDERFRGKGYGGLLVKEAFNRAAKAAPVKVQRIWTTPEDEYIPAKTLYTKEGFAEETYRPQAKDAARLISVWSRRADPENPTIREEDPESWKNSGYRIDSDKYTIPDLNHELGLEADHEAAAASEPRTCARRRYPRDEGCSRRKARSADNRDSDSGSYHGPAFITCRVH